VLQFGAQIFSKSLTHVRTDLEEKMHVLNGHFEIGLAEFSGLALLHTPLFLAGF